MATYIVNSVRDVEEGDEIRFGGRKTWCEVVDDDHYSCRTKWIQAVDAWGNEHTGRSQNDLAWGSTVLLDGDTHRTIELRTDEPRDVDGYRVD